MKHVFLTGMARSGTTLLDKLIGNHPNGAIASQPIPLLFIELKKAFYKTIGHPEEYYVLNHLFDENLYGPEDLLNFLKAYVIPREMLEKVLTNEGGYSGQYREYDKPEALAAEWSGRTLANTLELMLAHFFPGDSAFRGLKEIYMEEFIPYFLAEGWECAVVVRDPRNVLASMNKGKGSTYTGSIKPTLFNIRNWRKSVRYFEMEEVISVSFESMVEHPEEALLELVRRVSGREAPKNWIPNILLDEYGAAWKGNSSFASTAPKANQNRLSDEEINFIEAYCYDEMVRLGYELQQVRVRPRLKDDLPLNDPFNVNDERLKREYSDMQAQRDKEWALRYS